MFAEYLANKISCIVEPSVMLAQFASYALFITKMEVVASTEAREKILDGGYIYVFQKD